MTLMLVCLGEIIIFMSSQEFTTLTFCTDTIISIHFISSLCIGCIVACLKGTFIASLSLNLLITLTTGMKPHLKFIGIH